MNIFVVLGISLTYEVLMTLLPFVVVFLLLQKRQKQKGIAFSRNHVFAVLVFSVYVLGVYHFTGVGTLYDNKRYIFIIIASETIDNYATWFYSCKIYL